MTIADDMIPLSEMLEAVRREAMRAAADREVGRSFGDDGSFSFQLDDVVIETEVTLVRSGEASAEGKWLVMTFAAGAKTEKTRTHKLTLTFKPSGNMPLMGNVKSGDALGE